MKNTYDAALNKVTTNLKIDFESSISDEIKLCVFLGLFFAVGLFLLTRVPKKSLA
jgi:hypothetical protein